MRSSTFLFVILALLAVGTGILVLDEDGMVAGLQDTQFGNLVHFGAWGLVLAAGAVALFRTRFSQALKALAFWALAFVALIGLYAYAPEFSGIKDRLIAVLVPGTAIEIAGSDGQQFMVMRGNDEHFRIDGSINNEPVSFIVDTGASIVAMDTAMAEDIGIDTASLDYSIRVMTANGVARAAPIYLDTVRVGDIVRHDVEAAITEGDGLGMTLLGMSFLNTLTSFDFRGERLILTD